MSSKRQRLSVVSRQGGNPLRAALANAIEAAQEARSALASHDAAIECGRELVNSATAVVEHATAGVVAARDQHSDELAEAIAAGAALPASPAVARALNAEADANNKLEPPAPVWSD